MNIGVIGCGYVGLVSAAGFAELGHNVIAAESDAARSKLRQKGQSPFHERHLPELLYKHTGKRLQFRQSIEETVRQAKVCVGAPSLRSGETDILDAGIGFGGPCLPKDLHAFRALSRREGYRIDLSSEVIRIHQGQCFHFLEKVRMALSPLSGKRIAVLGLSFKRRTNDIRQSPAVEIVRHLRAQTAPHTNRFRRAQSVQSLPNEGRGSQLHQRWSAFRVGQFQRSRMSPAPFTDRQRSLDSGQGVLTRFSHATTARRDYLKPWHTGHRKGARNGEHPVNR